MVLHHNLQYQSHGDIDTDAPFGAVNIRGFPAFMLSRGFFLHPYLSELRFSAAEKGKGRSKTVMRYGGCRCGHFKRAMNAEKAIHSFEHDFAMTLPGCMRDDRMIKEQYPFSHL